MWSAARDLNVADAVTPSARSVLMARWRKQRMRRKLHVLIRFEVYDRHKHEYRLEKAAAQRLT
jgi:hypothetical protein